MRAGDARHTLLSRGTGAVSRRRRGRRLRDPVDTGIGSPFRPCGGGITKGSTVARKGDFTEILLRRRIISQDQLNEARQVSKDQNSSLADCIIKLGYASGEDVMRAVAQEHGRDYVDLTEVTIPEAVIELVPESVARENVILPLAEEEDALKVIVSDPYDIDTIEKLRFILNRRIEIALAPREKILKRSTVLRPDRRRIGRLDAPGVHRHGHRLHRNGDDDRSGVHRSRSTRTAPRSSASST